MTREDIIRMAREAGLGGFLAPHWDLREELEGFAALVAAAEREACAKVVEDLESVSPEEDNPAPWYIAAAIRARKENT